MLRNLSRLLVLLMAPAACCQALAATTTPPAATDTLAAITHTTVLPGSGHSWGFAAKDPSRPYLFIARRENGLTVFNTETQQAVRTLDDSSGANGVVFAPHADRVYLLNMDGSITVVRLSDLHTLKRMPVSDANLNNAVHEPSSGKIIIASGRRARQSTLYLLDPQQDRIVGQQDIDVKKIDPLLDGGDGSVLLPMRDEGKVMRLDGRTLALRSTYQWPGCAQPSAMSADYAGHRLFVACRGKAPILIVADLDQGTQVASLPITPAVNAIAWDAQRRRLLIPSGNNATLSFAQQEQDQQRGEHYRLLGHIGTRLWAHNMVYDPALSTAYLFTMDFTQPAADAGGHKQDPLFHADSFTVLTVRQNPPSR
jgi:hypothetical protein